MNLVSRYRRLEPILVGARFHPRRVAPLILVALPHHRRRFRRRLAEERIRVGLELLISADLRTHVILIDCAFTEPGDEQLPHSAVAPPHGMAADVPLVEFARHRHIERIRRPNGEADAPFRHMRAQRAIGLEQRAFRMQVEIGIGELRTVTVRVVDLDFAPVPESRANSISHWRARQRDAVEAVRMQLLHRGRRGTGFVACLVQYHRGGFRLREKRSHLPTGFIGRSCAPRGGRARGRGRRGNRRRSLRSLAKS